MAALDVEELEAEIQRDPALLRSIERRRKRSLDSFRRQAQVSPKTPLQKKPSDHKRAEAAARAEAEIKRDPALQRSIRRMYKSSVKQMKDRLNASKSIDIAPKQLFKNSPSKARAKSSKTDSPTQRTLLQRPVLDIDRTSKLRTVSADAARIDRSRRNKATTAPIKTKRKPPKRIQTTELVFGSRVPTEACRSAGDSRSKSSRPYCTRFGWERPKSAPHSGGGEPLRDRTRHCKHHLYRRGVSLYDRCDGPDHASNTSTSDETQPVCSPHLSIGIGTGSTTDIDANHRVSHKCRPAAIKPMGRRKYGYGLSNGKSFVGVRGDYYGKIFSQHGKVECIDTPHYL